MTLDGAAWMAIFVIFGAFLCVSAFIFETAQPDPISPDQRLFQAHPARSTEGAAARSRTPRRGQVSVAPSVDGGDVVRSVAQG